VIKNHIDSVVKSKREHWSIERYETSISYFMSNITIEIYTMFLFIHVVEQMWTVPVVQSTQIHSTIGYCTTNKTDHHDKLNIGESGVKHQNQN
jgi:hypothetical protein